MHNALRLLKLGLWTLEERRHKSDLLDVYIRQHFFSERVVNRWNTRDNYIVKVGPLLKRRLYCNSTSRAPALTTRIPRVVVCASGCISHTWPISRPHALTLQSSVVVTHLHTNCSSFYLPRRDGSQRQACPLRGSNPDLLYTRANMCRSG